MTPGQRPAIPSRMPTAEPDAKNHDDAPFSSPHAVANYAQGPPRMVPGFVDLQRMAAILLAETAPPEARILVVGAGGGLELKAFANAHAGWSFVGVDPSRDMLSLAQATLGALADRADLHLGTTDTAPLGPFDGATSLLTLHFIPTPERRTTLAEIHRRLKPGAPFVVAHLSIPANQDERSTWLSRYATFGDMPVENQSRFHAALNTSLHILAPEDDEQMLRDAGFQKPALFYAGFAFRGWIAHA